MATLWITLLLGGVVGLTCAPSSVYAARRSARPAVIRVPLTIHVASEDGRSVVSEGQILAAVRRANRELAGSEIHVYIRAIVPLQGDPRIETTRQRFELARAAERDGSVHIFYVDRVELTNPRKGDRRVSGVHWRYHGVARELRAREYLAVAQNAPSTTLVHELGHAFGLAHDKATDNLMCSCRRGPRPVFNQRQGQRLRGGARRFIARARRGP